MSNNEPITVKVEKKVPYSYVCDKCEQLREYEPDKVTMCGKAYYLCKSCKYQHDKELIRILRDYKFDDLDMC